MTMRWLCLFFPCRWIHIWGYIYQCSRCKTCSIGHNRETTDVLKP